jgi:hypothetical protein
MVILFQYINFRYLDLFTSKNFENFTYEEQLALAENNVGIYGDVNYIGTLFSACLVLHLFTKVLFNMMAEVKLPIDLWTIIDLCCSFMNIVAFQVIGSVKAVDILDYQKKSQLDYYVIALIIVSWVRFFSYFLVIRKISKLIMTLVQMIYDMLSFMFVFACYLLIIATIFTTLF